MTESCQLCKVIAGGSSDGFVTLFGNDTPVPEVLTSTREFLVVLDVAPVTPGHVLIVTRSHDLSFAAYWRSRARKLESVVDTVLTTLRDATGSPAVVCEHGLGPDAIGQAGCVEHAHLHVIPTRIPVVSAFMQTGVSLTELSDAGDQLDQAVKQQYIYLRDTDNRRYFAIYPRFPSQLVRRLIAQRDGEALWNWSSYVVHADEMGTRQRIRQALKIYQRLGRQPVFLRGGAHKSDM